MILLLAIRRMRSNFTRCGLKRDRQVQSTKITRPISVDSTLDNLCRPGTIHDSSQVKHSDLLVRDHVITGTIFFSILTTACASFGIIISTSHASPVNRLYERAAINDNVSRSGFYQCSVWQGILSEHQIFCFDSKVAMRKSYLSSNPA